MKCCPCVLIVSKTVTNLLTESTKIKIKRKEMSLLEKVEVSDKFDWEICIMMVRHHYDVNELTDNLIKKYK
jgi:hypothetical protein